MECVCLIYLQRLVIKSMIKIVLLAFRYSYCGILFEYWKSVSRTLLHLKMNKIMKLSEDKKRKNKKINSFHNVYQSRISFQLEGDFLTNRNRLIFSCHDPSISRTVSSITIYVFGWRGQKAVHRAQTSTKCKIMLKTLFDRFSSKKKKKYYIKFP